MMKFIRKTVLLLALVPIFILLNGCATSGKPYFKKKYFLAQNAYCTYFFCNRLNKNGAKITQNNHSFYIIIPIKKLFLSGSANFVPNAYNMLDNIAALLRCCDIEDAKITGLIHEGVKYHLTTSFQNEKARKKPKRSRKMVLDPFILATERARQVQDYLWLQKINASIIYATGKILPKIDDKKFVDQDYIIITFKKLY